MGLYKSSITNTTELEDLGDTLQIVIVARS